MIDQAAERFPSGSGTTAPGASFLHSKSLYHVAALLIVCIGAARIVSTYHQFTQTYDEAIHIACGMQLLQTGVYDIELQHPPLARIFVALGPYFADLRMPDHGTDATELGNAVLNTNGDYWHNLALARLGTLPFFLLACAVVWLWSNHLSGKRSALLALLVFSLVPAILGHGALATTDMAAAATLLLALYCLTLWLENPRWWAAAGMGAAAGLAMVTKFSAIPFLLGCAAAAILGRCTGGTSLRKRSWAITISMILAAIAVAYVVIWTGYFFSWAPLTGPPPYALVDRWFGKHWAIRQSAYALLQTRVPAGQLIKSIREFLIHNRGGHSEFFLGEWRRHGWWYFFPVIFLVKSPVPFLVLAGAGTFFLMRSLTRTGVWKAGAPILFTLVVFGLGSLGNINIGLRHILVVYPLLSIAAGYAAVALWDSARWPWLSRAAVAGLLAWLAGSTVFTHPDYLGYFNVLASERPERIEVDSDLDWGQDLARLSARLRARGVQNIALSYFGTADLSHAGLPPFQQLLPFAKTSGWIAISAHNRALPSPFAAKRFPNRSDYYFLPGDYDSRKREQGPFEWLVAYQPVERVGTSIFIYNIPDR